MKSKLNTKLTDTSSDKSWEKMIINWKNKKKSDASIVSALNEKIESKDRRALLFKRAYREYESQKSSDQNSNFGFGILFLIGGIIATAWSYNKSGSSGGQYYLYYGAIAVGLGSIIKGFINSTTIRPDSYFDSLFYPERVVNNDNEIREKNPVVIETGEGTLRIYSKLDVGYTIGDKVTLNREIPPDGKIKMGFMNSLTVKDGVIVRM